MKAQEITLYRVRVLNERRWFANREDAVVLASFDAADPEIVAGVNCGDSRALCFCGRDDLTPELLAELLNEDERRWVSQQAQREWEEEQR